MASIFRPSYTKIDPATGIRIKRRTAKWWIEFRDAAGVVCRVAGFRDKEATKQYAAKLEREASMERAGVVDPCKAHKGKLLADHLAGYERYLRSKGRDGKYVRLTVSRIGTAIAGMGAVRPADLTADRFVAWLRDFRETAGPEVSGTAKGYAAIAKAFGVTVATIHRWRHTGAPIQARKPNDLEVIARWRSARMGDGIGTETCNGYLTAMKGFTRWMTRNKRIHDDPLSMLSRENSEPDRRHVRRSLSPDDLRTLLATTEAGPEVFGFDGMTRTLMYAMASRLGFRRGELASLSPGSFVLDIPTPCVAVKAKDAKNRQEDVLPVHPEIVERLRSWLVQNPRERGELLFPGLDETNTAEMIRRDLDRAGIPYADDDHKVYDFHSLRGQLASDCARSGVPLATAQKLMRHSTPVLTANAYTKLGVLDLAGAVESLPTLDGPAPQANVLRATGTEGDRPAVTTPFPENSCKLDCKPRIGNDVTVDDSDVCEFSTADFGSAFPGSSPGGVAFNSPVLMPPQSSSNPCNSRGFRIVAESASGDSESSPVITDHHEKSLAPASQPASQTTADPHADPDLARLIDLWPTLPDPIRRAIVAMVTAAGGTPTDA